MDKRSYRLTTDKPGYGQSGQVVELHPRQAEYLLLTGAIAPLEPATESPVHPEGPGVATGSDGTQPSRRRTSALSVTATAKGE
jgi:hypothetical protein